MAIASGRYEQLIQDLRAEYRPQREWIERQGLFLIVGHFLSGVAAGTWFFSLLFGFIPGLAAAYVLAAVSGLAHLVFLGRPERFWKMWRARNSWIARGFIGLTLFMLGGLLYLPPLFHPDAPWSGDSWIAGSGYAVSVAGMVILLLYKGFVYASSKGIPFWTSPILPALYVAYALRGGVATLLLMFAWSGNTVSPERLGPLELWIGLSAAVMVLFYLGVMSGADPVARRSVYELVRGRAAVSFYLGTLVVGLVIPIAFGLAGVTGSLSLATLALVALASVVGDFFIKYTIAKAGIYIPLRPRSPH
ncbi:MAG: polysulfide reductase NrfD [Deltaproteobacteria bacterium]|nr:polysulfide reductase NrfD [Deltaproteobacteria bacterium]